MIRKIEIFESMGIAAGPGRPSVNCTFVGSVALSLEFVMVALSATTSPSNTTVELAARLSAVRLIKFVDCRNCTASAVA